MFREPGHSASSMTSFAAGLPNLPSCRAAIPPGRKCWPSQGVDVSRTGPQRIFHDFLCRRAAQPAELSSCQFRRAANVGQIRARMFREPGHSASSMTSFAAGLATLPSCRAVELSSINYAGQLMLAYKPHKMIQTT